MGCSLISNTRHTIHMVWPLLVYWSLRRFGSFSRHWEFRKAKTTISPTTPEKASYLVSGGIFRVTRNPMYLGMQLIIIAVIFKLGNYYGFIAAALFYLLHHTISNQT